MMLCYIFQIVFSTTFIIKSSDKNPSANKHSGARPGGSMLPAASASLCVSQRAPPASLAPCSHSSPALCSPGVTPSPRPSQGPKRAAPSTLLLTQVLCFQPRLCCCPCWSLQARQILVGLSRCPSGPPESSCLG